MSKTSQTRSRLDLERQKRFEKECNLTTGTSITQPRHSSNGPVYTQATRPLSLENDGNNGRFGFRPAVSRHIAPISHSANCKGQPKIYPWMSCNVSRSSIPSSSDADLPPVPMHPSQPAAATWTVSLSGSHTHHEDILITSPRDGKNGNEGDGGDEDDDEAEEEEKALMTVGNSAESASSEFPITAAHPKAEHDLSAFDSSYFTHPPRPLYSQDAPFSPEQSSAYFASFLSSPRLPRLPTPTQPPPPPPPLLSYSPPPPPPSCLSSNILVAQSQWERELVTVGLRRDGEQERGSAAGCLEFGFSIHEDCRPHAGRLVELVDDLYGPY